MPIHIAILAPPYDQMIVEGTKRIESRLTSQRRPPFGQITPGDVVYIKRSGGPFVARAQAARVLMADQLTPGDVDELAKRYNRWIGGTDAYWQQKRQTTRYATLIWLRNVQPISTGPAYKVEYMRAWYVLGDDAAPPHRNDCFEVVLTGGALRRHYVIVRSVRDRLPSGDTVKLQLDGHAVDVRYDQGKQMLRSAALGHWLTEQKLVAGDRLEFESLGGRRFGLRPIRANR